MTEFLQKIKLLYYLTLNLDIQQADFVSFLKSKIDDGNPNGLFQIFDLFSFSKNKFKGKVAAESFEIRKKRRFFDSNNYPTNVKAKYKQNNDQLIIAIEINGFPKNMIIFQALVFTLYFFFIMMYFLAANTEDESLIIGIVFFLVIFIISTTISYFIMRKNVTKMKELIENELLNKIKLNSFVNQNNE